MPDTPRLVIEAPRETLVRLDAETLLRRLIASKIQFACADDNLRPPSNTLLKYAAEAAAARIVNEQLAWPVTPDELTAALVKLGTARPDAEEAASRLVAEASLRDAVEQVSDAQAAEIITAYLGSAQFRINAIRPANVPAREPELVAPTEVPRPHASTSDEVELHVPTPQPPTYPEAA